MVGAFSLLPSARLCQFCQIRFTSPSVPFVGTCTKFKNRTGPAHGYKYRTVCGACLSSRTYMPATIVGHNMAFKSLPMGLAMIVATLFLLMVSETHAANFEVQLSNDPQALHAGAPFEIGLRSLEKRETAVAQVAKRITISLTPRACPPNNKRALITRCIGSKRSILPDESVLLFESKSPFDGVEHHLTLTVPPDFEKGWSVLSTTLVYVLGLELETVVETVNTTVSVG